MQCVDLYGSCFKQTNCKRDIFLRKSGNLILDWVSGDNQELLLTLLGVIYCVLPKETSKGEGKERTERNSLFVRNKSQNTLGQLMCQSKLKLDHYPRGLPGQQGPFRGSRIELTVFSEALHPPVPTESSREGQASFSAHAHAVQQTWAISQY